MKSQKKNVGHHAFFRDNKATTILKKAVKYKKGVTISSQIEGQLSLENAWLPPIFFWTLIALAKPLLCVSRQIP